MVETALVGLEVCWEVGVVCGVDGGSAVCVAILTSAAVVRVVGVRGVIGVGDLCGGFWGDRVKVQFCLRFQIQCQLPRVLE